MRKSNLLNDCAHSENHTERSNSMVFGFEKIMDSTMDIDILNLATQCTQVGERHSLGWLISPGTCTVCTL